MFGFTAHFVDEKIFIDSRLYLNNEILNACLSIQSGELNNHLSRLRKLRSEVQLRVGGDYIFCEEYDSKVQSAQNLFYRIGNIVRRIPPYNRMRDLGVMLDSPLLTDCLNDNYYLWEKGFDYDEFDLSRLGLDFCNEYGFVTTNNVGNYIFYIQHFKPDFYDLESNDPAAALAIEKTNSAVCRLFDQFITIIEDLVRVHTAYSELLDKYIHHKRKYLNDREIALSFVNYFIATENSDNTERVCSSGSMSINHEVHEGRLCDTYAFDSFGAFLYVDFFRGLERGYIPKRCDNCGRYFLLTGGKYSNYCDRPLKNDKEKTCRDVGSRRKYDDKCKNDPVWLAYNRAYKAHYARYMKKKMTTAEFERWSRYAVELRDKAENGELELVEYERLLKI